MWILKLLIWSLFRDNQQSHNPFSHGGDIFPQIFNSPIAAKLLIGSKKVRGCKNGTNLLYYHPKYGEDRGSRAGCKQKM